MSEDNLQELLDKGIHLKQDRFKSFTCGYTWGTEYAREKFEEKRVIQVPEETSYNVLYAYQVITQADLRHMVVYNAYEQGSMEKNEKKEILNASKADLKRVVKNIKEIDEDGNVGKDIRAIFEKIRDELEEENIIKRKRKNKESKN